MAKRDENENNGKFPNAGSWRRLTKERLLVDELKLISVVLSDRAVYENIAVKTKKNITAREPYGRFVEQIAFRE